MGSAAHLAVAVLAEHLPYASLEFLRLPDRAHRAAVDATGRLRLKVPAHVKLASCRPELLAGAKDLTITQRHLHPWDRGALLRLTQLERLAVEADASGARYAAFASRLPNLTSLSLHDNQLGARFHCSLLAGLSALQVLVISGNGLRHLDGVAALRSLTCLEVGTRAADPSTGGCLSDEAWRQVAALPQLRRLKTGASTLSQGAVRHLGALVGLQCLDAGESELGDASAMLAAMAPALTALTLASSFALGPRAAACLASLTALRELAVLEDDGCGGLGPEEAASIAGLRQLRQLRLLHQERLGCRGAALLSALSALTELDVRGADLATLAGIERLAMLRALRKLDISWNGLDAAMVAGLAPLSALHELQLRESPALGAAGARCLSVLSSLTALRTFGYEPPCGEVLLVLGAHWPQLASLELVGSTVVAPLLLHLSSFSGLSHLSLCGGEGGVGDAGAACVAELLPALRALDISQDCLGPEGVRRLADGLTSLQRLELFYNPSVGNAGVAHLRGMRRLTELDVSGCGLDDAGLLLLSGITSLRKLVVLDQHVGLETLTALEAMPCLLSFEHDITMPAAAAEAAWSVGACCWDGPQSVSSTRSGPAPGCSTTGSSA